MKAWRSPRQIAPPFDYLNGAQLKNLMRKGLMAPQACLRNGPELIGGPGWIRTNDQGIMSPLL